MKIFAILTLSIAPVLTLGLYACGSSDGPSCADVCAKMTECNPDNAEGCDTQCPKMKEIMRSSVYRALGDCYMDTDCDTLNQNNDVCMIKAMAEIPDGVVDDFIGKLCDKMVSCSDGLTKEQCITTMKKEGGDSMQMAGMFADSVLNCVTDCVAGKDCSAIESESAVDDCMTQCGMSFDDSQ